MLVRESMREIQYVWVQLREDKMRAHTHKHTSCLACSSTIDGGKKKENRNKKTK